MTLVTLTKKNFENYGTLLQHGVHQQPNGYEKIAVMPSNGWIWALMTINNKSIEQLECHPNTRESFEPLTGTTVIVVALYNEPNSYQAFLLDVPILLNKGIWHQVMCISESASFKIVENNEVATEFYTLQSPLKLIVSSVY